MTVMKITIPKQKNKQKTTKHVAISNAAVPRNEDRWGTVYTAARRKILPPAYSEGY
jgi:hypothetical protein